VERTLDAVAVVAFDHGGADHVNAVAARHDVKRDARMQEAHGPRKIDVARAHDQHLAFDAAQVLQGVAGGKAARIDGDIRRDGYVFGVDAR
jgi:hypothetical protein